MNYSPAHQTRLSKVLIATAAVAALLLATLWSFNTI